MNCRLEDFRYKDVVNMENGVRLGCVSDVEINTTTARLTALIIRGQARLWGLLGRREDTVIPWEDIGMVGEDTILVRVRNKEEPKDSWRSGFFPQK